MGIKMSMVLKRVMYESERNAPSKAKAQDMPMKLVTFVEEPATPMCMVFLRYTTRFNVVEVNPTNNITAKTANTRPNV